MEIEYWNLRNIPVSLALEAKRISGKLQLEKFKNRVLIPSKNGNLKVVASLSIEMCNFWK